MKRILVALLFFCVATATWAFNLSQITYLQAELPNGGPVVQIVSMNQFIKLVESKQAGIVYRVKSGTTNHMFAFVADGAVYRTAANGFKTLVDAQTAIQMGLKTGGEFAVAHEFGIRDLSSIYYANSEYFPSGEDYRAAMQGGFKGSAAAILTAPMPFWFYAYRPYRGATLAMPNAISSSDFQNILLPQIAWYVLVFNSTDSNRRVIYRNGTRKEPTPSNISSLNGAGILRHLGIEPRRDWTWQEYNSAVKKLVANSEFGQWTRGRLRMYRSEPNGDLRTNGQKGTGPNLMTAIESFGIHITDREALTYRIKLERSMGDHTPPPPQPVPYIADSMKIVPRFPTDSLVYAMARLFGMKTEAEYLSLNVAVEAGYGSAADEEASKAGGFRRPGNFYKAKELGAATLSEYNKVAGLPNEWLAKRYLHLVSALTELKNKYHTKDVNQLTIAYALVNLPRGVPYGVTGILNNLSVLEARYLNPVNSKTSYFTRAAQTVGRTLQPVYNRHAQVDLSVYSGSISEERIGAMLRGLETLSWIDEIGKYDPLTGVFVRS